MSTVTQPIEIALDETGRPEGQILADSIRQWRSDCQAGQFKIGAATMRGPKLGVYAQTPDFSGQANFPVYEG